MKHPMQPIIRAHDGVIRFQENAIINFLFKIGSIDLNMIARITDFTDDDRMQLAMLLGYSVSGFGDLNYASESVIEQADAVAQHIIDGE